MPEASWLDWGLRCVRAGVILRHVPSLALPPTLRSPVSLPVDDEVRLVVRNFGFKWALWALGRALRTGAMPVARVSRGMAAALRIRKEPQLTVPAYRRPVAEAPATLAQAKVSVLIPTLDRYPYLETLLGQLEKQTVPPHEVIVVDQTEPGFRRFDLPGRYPGLCIQWLTMDQPGQCSSRNEGLRKASGEWILFLDDDVEVPPDFLQRHLSVAEQFGADAVSGTVYEPPEERGASSEEDRIRVSDVFPTNTTLLKKEALAPAGLFDLAYDRGQVEDADLGMRLYLSGTLLLLDEGNCILHHHAPRGGLRSHGARVVTRAMAKRSPWHTALPSAWDFYLALRYFGEDAAREVEALAVLQSFSTGGSAWRRILRVAVGFALLPATIARVLAAQRVGERLADQGPNIPSMASGARGDEVDFVRDETSSPAAR